MANPAELSSFLRQVVARLTGDDCPPRLAAAIEHAVLPGGGRLRPQLLLAVSKACGGPRPQLAQHAAASLELIHCASLVHDDLPCFDDAELRRGLPSVQQAHGEAVAVLAGDALIAGAFEVLSWQAAEHPREVGELLSLLSQASGSARGIVAGQGWESEPTVSWQRYHRAKTAALFEAATTMGAVAAGRPAGNWRSVGEEIGRAYQLADDLADRYGLASRLGKAPGRDRTLSRPSAFGALSGEQLRRRLRAHLQQAIDAIPPAIDHGQLHELLADIAARLLPAASEGSRHVGAAKKAQPTQAGLAAG